MTEDKIWTEAFEKLSAKEKKSYLKGNDSHANIKATIKLIQFYREISPKYQEKNMK